MDHKHLLHHVAVGSWTMGVKPSQLECSIRLSHEGTQECSIRLSHGSTLAVWLMGWVNTPRLTIVVVLTG